MTEQNSTPKIQRKKGRPTKTEQIERIRAGLTGNKAETQRTFNLANRLLVWKEDPAVFVKDLLKVEPDEWQKRALRSLIHNDRVAIRSGHGVGKTACLAWVAIWWILTRYPCRVVCTANTVSQLEQVLWPEIRKWVYKLPQEFQDQLDVTSDHVFLKADPTQAFVVARTSSKERPEALQGFHSDNMLFILDEASGIPDIIFEVARGTLTTPGSKVIMTGNPTRVSGFFYEAFHGMRHRWETLKVSSEEAKYVDPEFVKEMKQDYGEDSNIYRVRVLGEFPKSDDDGVIPLNLIEEAVLRDVEPTGQVIWGLDVARFGDDRTALCVRHGNVIKEQIKFWRNKDVMQIVGLIKNMYDRCRGEFYHLRPAYIVVDVIGLGAGVVDRMREIGLPVYGCNVAESAAADDKFMRKRDELWWNVREWLEDRSSKMVNDPELIAELTLPRYRYESSGKIKVESKDDIKRRGRKSPDLADALCLTFAAPIQGQELYQRKNYKLPELPTNWIV